MTKVSLFVFTFNFFAVRRPGSFFTCFFMFSLFWFFCLVKYFLSLSSVSLYFLSLFCVFVPCLPLSFSRCSHLCIFSISLFFFLFSIYLFCFSHYLLNRTWTVRVIAIQILRQQIKVLSFWFWSALLQSIKVRILTFIFRFVPSLQIFAKNVEFAFTFPWL
jgi:hypothetical protein